MTAGISVKLIRRNKITSTIVVCVTLSFIPSCDVVDVPLPEKAGHVRVSRDGDDYYVSVTTPNGSFEKWMWTDWGPAQRTGLYVTSEGWIAALGAGGAAAFIAMPEDGKPFDVTDADVARTDSATWRYMGAVDRDYATGSLRFFGPTEQPECTDMFGAGESQYRFVAQWETACDCVQRAAKYGEACNIKAFPMAR
ncbi:hypothetical protein BLJAPNOD_02323 [Ensifer sp. M14]|uniref:hypothetical protein n=1 Tax=Ensifer sp. M14 TaxID=2203782 RepID=UPI000E1DDFD2|nr:hypothetical protein [Ensifer sp. M14]RDL51191.1 hypothetical protein BLJAPNOD_02323 [Ensifer sp. M14]